MEILRLTWDNELTAGEVASNFDITFPAISQHLKVLRDAGAISMRVDGVRRYYRARPEVLGPLKAVLEQMWSGDLARLADVAGRKKSP